jgi:hypothetical protein
VRGWFREHDVVVGLHTGGIKRVRDAIRLAAVILGGVLSRRSVRPRGNEAGRALPGDELLPDAKGRWTHGITIRGRPADIWPWLVQMGCRRAGWYSYDGLDNGGIPSAVRVVPEFQFAEVGDVFPWTPTASDGFFVQAVDPERSLVLGGDAGTQYRVTWAFVLTPIDAANTRLIIRASGNYRRWVVGLALKFLWRPIDFGMQRR